MGIVRMASSIFKPRPQPPCDAWQEFFSDPELLERNHVTAEELEILHDFAPLGAVICLTDILFILATIRWARDRKPDS
jgi:hypothetical protein